MGSFYQFRRRGASGSSWGGWLLALLWLLGPVAGWAQAPAWSSFSPISIGLQMSGTSTTRATTVDASGNIFVTGSFDGQVYFGGVRLTSRGNEDLFVAKYVPSTGTWAWAQSGGGIRADVGWGIAVSGTSVYVTGSIINNTANTAGVLFGSTGTTVGTVQQKGATSTLSSDIIVVKYTDNGSTATLGWTQVGGGTSTDVGYGIAASGNSVYVTGTIINSTTNVNGVLFGGTGNTTGIIVQHGATSSAFGGDLVVAKYTDNGSTATVGWTQVGGGTSTDVSHSIAVSGSSVYVTGYIESNRANATRVVFGGAGTTVGIIPQHGATSSIGADLVVAKYTDNGSTATLGWTQVGGGSDGDKGYGIAASGNSVYVTGYIVNGRTNASQVLFGGAGTAVGTFRQYGAGNINMSSTADIIVAKYTDNGSTATLRWTQVGGGISTDGGYGIAVSGTNVYVTGAIYDNINNGYGVLFGGAGTTAGTIPQSGASNMATSRDIVVAKYIDNGGTATVDWTQVAGGSSDDYGYGIAVHGTNVYVGGLVFPTAMFGSIRFYDPISFPTGFLAQLATTPLPTRQPTAATTLSLYPNPAHASVRVQVPDDARAPLQLFDRLGRVVRTQPAPAASSPARELPLLGLPPGLYVLRCGAQTQRLVVE